MPDIDISKNDIPFFLKGTGTLTVHAGIPSLEAPLAPSDSDLVSVDFGVAADPSFTFGATGNLTMDIKGGTSVRLVPLFPSSSADRLALLQDHGLDSYFTAHPDGMLLGLLLNASGELNAAGSFTYSVLTASASLDVGGAAGYIYWHPFLASTPFKQVVKDFFGDLRLPGNIDQPPPFGEVIGFDYNGYLKIGAGLSLGYQLQGAPSFALGQLQLSENYQLSIIGKLGLSAQIAGEFSVEVGAALDDSGKPLADWARVVIKKKRSSQFQIAADVNVDAQSDLEGLPDSGDEFLGAALGVQAKNWLNLLAHVRDLSNFDNLKQELDGLAQRFLGEMVGKAFDALSATEFNTFLQTVKTVVDDYENLDNFAITLFDHYFAKLDILTDKLNQLVKLTSWDSLKGKIDGDLWTIVSQLTDGDPLTWMLGQIQIHDKDGKVITIPSLPELQARVQKALNLIQDDAHSEIRKVIALAKSKFPLDHFFGELDKVDSVDSLRALANQDIGDFVQRLIGKAIDDMSKSEIGDAVTHIHQILTAAKNFEDNLYGKFKEAAHQSFSFKLHAEYSRASERDALVDVEINLSTSAGKQLMAAAGRGDFQDVLASVQPELVRINHGVLTHKVTKESAFSINILGWHHAWNYSGMDRLILATEQQIVTEKNGGLSVYTSFDLTKDKVRQRTNDKAYTNFLLRFIGESHGVLEFDQANQQYLIDAITSMSASYTLGFADKKTKRERLAYYLSFAQAFGLAGQGATVGEILPLLPPVTPGADNFGEIDVEYQVRYTEAALRTLFTAPVSEDAVRGIMRKIVLANYLREPNFENRGWAYWTQGVHDLYKQGESDFSNVSSRTFHPDASPFAHIPARQSVTLSQFELRLLGLLFDIEDSLVKGLQALKSLVDAKQKISAEQFEKALSDVGDALKDFDGVDEGVNTVFAVLDQLVALQTDTSQARESSLTLDSFVGDKKVSKVFVSGGEAAGEHEIAA